MDTRRRALLTATLALPLAARAQPATPQAGEPRERLALLVGNGDYPDGEDLPPVRKNLADLQQALQALGFEVWSHLDVGPAQFRHAIAGFAQQAAARGHAPMTLFYFCGHGVEAQGDNLLLPARVPDRAPAAQLKRDAINLQREVLGQLPHAYPGLSVTVIDACRRSLGGASPLRNIATDAPEGSLLVYSTQPGRPALMPDDPERNSFFTEALVQSLRQHLQPGSPYRATSVYAVFQNVRAEVRAQMSRHPLRQVREAAQDPHILHNIRTDLFFFAPAASAHGPDGGAPAYGAPEGAVPPSPAEAQRWQALAASRLPGELLQRAHEYLAEFPGGPRSIGAQVLASGAERAAQALAEPGMPLRPSGLADVRGSERARLEALNAAQGDKDAAQRVGEWYARGAEGLDRNERRAEAWLRFASAMGSGLASKRLVRLYQDQGRVNEAALYRSRALDQGELLEPELTGERK